MSPDERRKKSNIETLLAAAKTDRVRAIFSETKRGDRNPMKRADVAEKVSRTVKEKWGPFFAEKMRRTWRDGRLGPHTRKSSGTTPNKQEIEFGRVLAKVAPRFEFVGCGTFWIGPCPSGKRRNPDFIDKERRRVILFHGEFWHPPESAEIETADYEAKGWTVLVVWSKELRQKERARLIDKLRAFDTQPS